MTEHLEEQLTNELRALLKQLNHKYQDFYHFQVLTLIDMQEQTCPQCIRNEVKPKCLRAVIGFQDHSKCPPDTAQDEKYCTQGIEGSLGE